MVGEPRAREATEADSGRIADIYNQGIEDRVATFETQLRTAEDVRSWFAAPYPIVVVESDGDLIAWANASRYRPRACYAGICEFSVYVDRSARGSGAGKVAMLALIAASSRAGYSKLLSRVFVENMASRHLLQGLGFREVGVYHRHGQLDGIWRDVVIVERLLDDRESLWDRLVPGTHIQVAKGHWHGQGRPARYPATVITSVHQGWIAVEATWAFDDFEIAGVQFEHGGRIIEYFSASDYFNVFQVFRRDGSTGGLYANVAAPARIELDHHGEFVLAWEDLWIDVVKSPAGAIATLDEHELAASGVIETNPQLAITIRAAQQQLLTQVESGIWDI